MIYQVFTTAQGSKISLGEFRSLEAVQKRVRKIYPKFKIEDGKVISIDGHRQNVTPIRVVENSSRKISWKGTPHLGISQPI